MPLKNIVLLKIALYFMLPLSFGGLAWWIVVPYIVLAVIAFASYSLFGHNVHRDLSFAIKSSSIVHIIHKGDILTYFCRAPP